MATYQTFLTTLNQWGLTDVLIPFALIFTIIFALMQKLKIFKAKKTDGTIDDTKADKKISTIVSLGVALASLIPHFTKQGFDIVVFINNYLPNSFLILFLVILFLALIGTVSDIKKPGEHPLIGIIAILAIVCLVFVLLQSAQITNYPFLNFLNDPNTQAIAIVLLVFILLIWYISRPSKTQTELDEIKKNPLKGLKQLLQRGFGG